MSETPEARGSHVHRIKTTGTLTKGGCTLLECPLGSV